VRTGELSWVEAPSGHGHRWEVLQRQELIFGAAHVLRASLDLGPDLRLLRWSLQSEVPAGKGGNPGAPALESGEVAGRLLRWSGDAAGEERLGGDLPLRPCWALPRWLERSPEGPQAMHVLDELTALRQDQQLAPVLPIQVELPEGPLLLRGWMRRGSAPEWLWMDERGMVRAVARTAQVWLREAAGGAA
jgi:hypothetical protein